LKFTLRFSQLAIQDIEDVLAHTLMRFGHQKHEQYKLLIRLALTDISLDPDRPPARKRPELHPNARTFHIGCRGKRARHFFLYRVIDETTVEIGRLLHDSMDLKAHLPEGFDVDE
jgi:toxin ParE1/3/4